MSDLDGLNKLDKADVDELLGRDLKDTYTSDELERMRRSDQLKRVQNIGYAVLIFGGFMIVLELIIAVFLQQNHQADLINRFAPLLVLLDALILVIGGLLLSAGRRNYSLRDNP